MHVRPTEISSLKSFINFAETHDPTITQQLYLHLYQLQPLVFDYRFKLFMYMMNNKQYKYAFLFILDYFKNTIQTKRENFIQEITSVIQEFLKNNQSEYAIQLLQFGVRVEPKEVSFYDLLFELYRKKEEYLRVTFSTCAFTFLRLSKLF